MGLLKLNTISAQHLRTEKHFIWAHNSWRSKKNLNTILSYVIHCFSPAATWKPFKVQKTNEATSSSGILIHSCVHVFMYSSIHPSIHPFNKSAIRSIFDLGKEAMSSYIQIRLGKVWTWDDVKSWCQSALVSVFSLIQHFAIKFPVLGRLKQGSQSTLKFRRKPGSELYSRREEVKTNQQ